MLTPVFTFPKTMPHRHHNTLLPNPQPRHRSRSPCRSSTSPTRQYHRQCAPVIPIPSSPLNPNPSSRSNMMMYNPYQWGGGMMGGQGVGYPGMQNPYMMGKDPSVMGSMPAPSQSAAGTEDRNLRPFDSSKMKQGRLGHYGYLEGRGECAFFEMNKLLITRQNSQVLLSAISLLAFNLNTRHLKPVMVLFQPDLVQAQVIKAMDHGVTWPISLVRVTTVVCIYPLVSFESIS